MSSTLAENGCPPSKKGRVEEVTGLVWRVKASRESRDCVNPVRSCEEIYFKEALENRDKSKELIKVSIGEREGGGREIVKLCMQRQSFVPRQSGPCVQ